MYKLPKEVSDNEEEKAFQVYQREIQIVQNLVIPGAHRHLMPSIPTKSKRLREFEKPQMYPFCTLPIEDVERGLVQKQF